MVVIWDKNIKELTWVVISARWDKTIVVSVEKVKMNEKVRKRSSLQKKYHAHDEVNSAKVWDTVLIREHRPISKLKRWNLIEIVSQSEEVSI
jgi:small subunit ribosomal protein S17